MKYYALAQDLPAGSPPGALNAVLIDRLYPCAFENGYNAYPWYARKTTDAAPVFNDRMILLIRNIDRDFELARISSDIFICSTRFLQTCKELNVEIIDHQKIETELPQGKILHTEYNAIIFKKIDIEEAASSSSTLVQRNGRARRIKKLEIIKEFKEHLFIFRYMEGSSDTLICSEAFRSSMQNHITGIAFIDIENAEWPRVKAI